MPTDDELIEEVRKGSQAAMEVLTRRYYKLIYAILYRRTGDPSISYDLTQEVFIKMLKGIDTYSQRSQFRTWLITIAINHCRDYYKSKVFKQGSAEVVLEDTHIDERQNVPFIFEKKEKREQVKRAIAELPEPNKECIILKYFHDLTFEEISIITSSNLSTVKSRTRRALDLLKQILGGEEHEHASKSERLGF